MPNARKYIPKPLTPSRLQELAMRYLGRFAATRAMLERTLMNHLRRAKQIHPDLNEAAIRHEITLIADKAVRQGYVNDQSYAESLSRQGRRSGWSKRKITQKLLTKGVGKNILQTLAANDEDDLQAALIFARRKHLGPHRKHADSDRNKEMEKICRAGFSLDIARKIIRLTPAQLEEMEDELRTK